MLKPPVSLFLLIATSLKCLHMINSNYLPCETQGARLTVKSHTLLHIANILVFKKHVSTMWQKKKKGTENPCLAFANWDTSPTVRSLQNL